MTSGDARARKMCRKLRKINSYATYMKKTVISVKEFGLMLLCLMVAFAPLTSCQKEKTANVEDLLSTVPSSAGMVVGFNLSSLLEKAGCKIDGSSVTPGKEIKESLDAAPAGKQNDLIKALLSGETGIDPVGAILFTDAYNTYFTAAIADTEKYSDFIVKQTELPFEDAGDNVRISGCVAISGAQTWIGLSNGSLDAKAIKNYANLDKTQSFASLEAAKDMTTMTHDIVGFGQIKNFIAGRLSFSNEALLNLCMGFLFDNATALSFYQDFNNGEVISKAMVLNDKSQPAKYLLPADKISVDEVKKLPANANTLAAAAISKTLVKKVSKMAESFGGTLPATFSAVANVLDGTSAIAIGTPETMDPSYSAIIATDGKAPLEMMQFLSTFGNTQKEDKIVKLSKGEVNGALEVEKMADRLKGATIGVVSHLDADSNDDAVSMLGMIDRSFESAGAVFTTLTATLTPESNSLSLNLNAETANKDENSLLALLQAALK